MYWQGNKDQYFETFMKKVLKNCLNREVVKLLVPFLEVKKCPFWLVCPNFLDWSFLSKKCYLIIYI